MLDFSFFVVLPIVCSIYILLRLGYLYFNKLPMGSAYNYAILGLLIAFFLYSYIRPKYDGKLKMEATHIVQQNDTNTYVVYTDLNIESLFPPHRYVTMAYKTQKDSTRLVSESQRALVGKTRDSLMKAGFNYYYLPPFYSDFRTNDHKVGKEIKLEFPMMALRKQSWIGEYLLAFFVSTVVLYSLLAMHRKPA
jgi:hypothetical protein